jgi:hypothetical protein
MGANTLDEVGAPNRIGSTRPEWMVAMRKLLLPVAAAFFYSLSPSIADTSADFSGSDWEEAVSNIPCDHLRRNGDGTWTVQGTVRIAEITFVNPTLSDEVADFAASKCS